MGRPRLCTYVSRVRGPRQQGVTHRRVSNSRYFFRYLRPRRYGESAEFGSSKLKSCPITRVTAAESPREGSKTSKLVDPSANLSRPIMVIECPDRRLVDDVVVRTQTVGVRTDLDAGSIWVQASCMRPFPGAQTAHHFENIVPHLSTTRSGPSPLLGARMLGHCSWMIISPRLDSHIQLGGVTHGISRPLSMDCA